MDSTIYEILLEKAQEQLDKLTGQVTDGSWFDSLVEQLSNEIQGSNFDPTVVELGLEAVSLLQKNRDVLIGLGKHAFMLLLCQITCGRDDEAVATYIRALTNADDLIALMNSGSDGVIKAKIELDRLNAQAKKLAFDFATAGMRIIIPFLLSLI